MSPEFGSTAAIFPIDEVTLDYLRLTGRSDEQVALVEAYAKAQGLWHDPADEPVFSEYLELDLSTVVPSIAGPKRPQDRIALADAKEPSARTRNYVDDYARAVDEAVDERPPATRRLADNGRSHRPSGRPTGTVADGASSSTTAPSRSPRSPRAPTPPTPR